MTPPSPDVRRRILNVFARMSSPHDGETLNARNILNRILSENGLSWNDLPALLAANAEAVNDDNVARDSAPSGSGIAEEAAPTPNVLDLVMRLIEEHVAVTPAERTAIALWVLHTHVFGRFSVTPRLAIVSPTHGCGKTTLLLLLELLAALPFRTDDITPATIYHELEQRPHTTMLIDEVDNHNLFANVLLRSVVNSGHRSGGSVARYIRGETRRLPTFAPLAVAAIGHLPGPLMHRAIVVQMTRAKAQYKLGRLDESDPAFVVAREAIASWAEACHLVREPEMPPQLHNRAADNWRVLLAIADNLGRGEEGRAAAIELCANHFDEDVRVTLLRGIQAIFSSCRVDRISSKALVEALTSLDDSLWSEWRGLQGNRLPRPMTQAELAALLRPFGLKPKTIWPAQRQPDDKSARGYLRADLEPIWAAYCDSPDATSQSNGEIRLRAKS